MPKPRIRRPRVPYATDHRALVLEAVATSPRPATLESIVADVTGIDSDFSAHSIGSMVWWLRREGLIGRDDHGGHFITAAGLDYLTAARFDRALPAKHERPGARKPRGPRGRK